MGRSWDLVHGRDAQVGFVEHAQGFVGIKARSACTFESDGNS